ncbi:MAG: hypothetical protein U1A16_01480, partial [Patescibacteria group bacterium]|nr:hypothetical protein [Patescibacteria group bacterium]
MHTLSRLLTRPPQSLRSFVGSLRSSLTAFGTLKPSLRSVLVRPQSVAFGSLLRRPHARPVGVRPIKPHRFYRNC